MVTSRDRRQALIEEVLSGRSRDLQLLTARGLLPLSPGDVIPLQVSLTGAADEEISSAASESLRSLDPKIVADAIDEGTDPDVVAFLAFHLRHPTVLQKVLQLRKLSPFLLKQLAARLAPDSQEILLLRQDAIVEDPGILDALETNPDLSAYARRRIAEYREHLVPWYSRGGAAPGREAREKEAPGRGAPPREESAAEPAEGPGFETDRTAAAPGEAELEDVEIERLTDLGESEIRTLPTPLRLKLSRGAPRSLRNILIRDSNPVVALSVLNNNPLGDGEVEQIASSRSVIEEVLEQIGRSRQWVRRYEIVLALVGNPRTPAGLAVRLLPRLSVRDLRTLSRDRNVPEAVRSRATKLYRIKQQ